MKTKLKKALYLRPRSRITDDGLSQAAVMVPILCKDGLYNIVFTTRSQQVVYHKGQVSFPGGRKNESDEDLLETAIRETMEEIGLQKQEIEILGELDDHITVSSRFVISPFVGFIPYPYEFKISHDEIDELFYVPVPALLQLTDVIQEHKDNDGQIFQTYTYNYDGRIIWGATAGILHQLLDIWKAVSAVQNLNS
jgi:8-oxo-dGTP pyrophosphatase MutT (NUDIX family)